MACTHWTSAAGDLALAIRFESIRQAVATVTTTTTKRQPTDGFHSENIRIPLY